MDRCVEVCSGSGSNDCDAFVQMIVVIEMNVKESAKLFIYVLTKHSRSDSFMASKYSYYQIYFYPERGNLVSGLTRQSLEEVQPMKV